jgi:hypothetical protein
MLSQLVLVTEIKIFNFIRIVVVAGDLILRSEIVEIKRSESLFDHTFEVFRHRSTHVDNFRSSLQEVKSVKLICRAIKSN